MPFLLQAMARRNRGQQRPLVHRSRGYKQTASPSRRDPPWARLSRYARLLHQRANSALKPPIAFFPSDLSSLSSPPRQHGLSDRSLGTFRLLRVGGRRPPVPHIHRAKLRQGNDKRVVIKILLLEAAVMEDMEPSRHSKVVQPVLDREDHRDSTITSMRSSLSRRARPRARKATGMTTPSLLRGPDDLVDLHPQGLG